MKQTQGDFTDVTTNLKDQTSVFARKLFDVYFDHFSKDEYGNGTQCCFSNIEISIVNLCVKFRCEWFDDIRMSAMNTIVFRYFRTERDEFTEVEDHPKKQSEPIELMNKNTFSTIQRFD